MTYQVKIRQAIVLLITITLVALLAACGSSGSSGSSTPITVTLSTVPTSLQVAATQAITATVANDSANGGVTWSCAPAGTCGSFSSNQTSSGVAVTYTAPVSVPSSTVVIKATSVSNSTVSASTAAITITPSPAITVTLSTTPSALYVNDTTPITATVSGDPAKLGVTWSCAPAGACGSFSSNQTASGVAVTYTAPSTVPTSTVVITATSISNTAISASTPAITIDPASGITVTLSAPPPLSLAPGGTASIAATLMNDSANGGVTWSCAPANSCGSFNPTATASAEATAYTAPSASGVVTITATSVTDNAVSASATVTITTAGSGTLTAGNYVFTLSGTDANDSFYSVSGVFTLASDGATITGGEQDIVDDIIEDQDGGLTGTVAPAGDGTGNLVITLNTGDFNIGPAGNGVETLVATLVSNSAAVISEYDTWASSSGRLDLQNSTAATATPSAGYAFVVGGWDPGQNPLAIGGVINVDGSGTISGTGSVFDANDVGTTFPDETFAASTVSAPDPQGRVEFTLVPTDFNDFGTTIVLAGYIVDAGRIRLVETLDGYGGATGGTAFGQGTNTGKFTSISGKSYVAGLSGGDTYGGFQLAGLLAAGSTSFTGTVNFNDLTGKAVQAPDPVTEGTQSYTLDPTGRVSIPGMTDGNVTFNLQLYLDGNGNALAITLDNTDVLAGLGYQQTGGGSFTASSFKGTYALNAVGVDLNNHDELDAVGPVAANGAGALAGSADLNWIFINGPTPDLPVSGTFTAAASGIFTGTLTGLDVTTVTNGDAFAYYLVDPTRVIGIETDPNQLTLGFFLLQQ